MIGGIISGIGNLLSGGAQVYGAKKNVEFNQKSFDYSKSMDDRNFAFALEQQKYDRAMQERMFGREDNAVQRRIADLKAAGLSPVLAAGQSAASGATYKSEAPAVNSDTAKYLSAQGKAIYDGSKAFETASTLVDRLLAVQQAQANISKTSAERDLLALNADKTIVETDYIKQNAMLNAARLGLIKVDTAAKGYNLEESKQVGLRTGEQPNIWTIGTALGKKLYNTFFGNQSVDQYKNALEVYSSKFTNQYLKQLRKAEKSRKR